MDVVSEYKDCQEFYQAFLSGDIKLGADPSVWLVLSKLCVQDFHQLRESALESYQETAGLTLANS